MIFLIVFLGHFAYGITNVLWKNPQNSVGTFSLIMMRSLGCILVFASIFGVKYYLGYEKLPSIDFQNFIKVFALCIINSFGLVFYLKSLQYGTATKVVGFSKLNIIIWILIGFVFLQTEISLKKIVLGSIIALGIYFIESDGKRKEKIKFSKSLVFTILSRLFWATAFFFIPFIKEYGALFFCIILELAVFTVSFLTSLFQKDKISIMKIEDKTLLEVLVLVIFGCIGTLCLNYAIAENGIFLFAILAAMEPVIGILFARIYYKDTLEKRQVLGMTLALSSSFLLAL